MRSVWRKKNAVVEACGPGRGFDSWTPASFVRPSEVAVAKLADSHGFQACVERWGYISKKGLQKMVFDGRQQMKKESA